MKVKTLINMPVLIKVPFSSITTGHIMRDDRSCLMLSPGEGEFLSAKWTGTACKWNL
jgi:hypothetical protein